MKNKKLLKVVSLMALATTCVASGVLALNTKVANAASEGVFHELGASVRVSTTDKGIRFVFGLPEDKTGDGYEIGTLVIPKDVLGDAVLNHNNDTVDAVAVDYMPIPCTKNWVPNEELDGAQDGYNYYNAALTGIPELNYNTVLVARSYYKDNEGNYTYSDPIERSIGYVASAALNDGYKDTKNILTSIVSTAYGDTALTIEGGEELLSVADALTLTASNEKGYLPVWSSSNESVATADKTGKIDVKKGGETTITATIGNVSATKTVYIVGDGLYSDQIGARINGWNQSSVADYCGIQVGENGEITVSSKFQANATYSPALILRNMHSKAYYEKLIANGYTKLAFNLAVEGDVTDLYVFGKLVSTFPVKDGVYSFAIDVQHIVNHYDTMKTIATSGNQVGQASSLAAKLISWKSPANDWSTVRDYVFTISNPEFKIPTLNVEFAEGSKDIFAVDETTTLVADANVNGDIIWSSSNNEVATVEGGVVTGVKGGEVTITATLGELKAEKTVYVVGDGLYSDQIGARINGWNQSSVADYCGIQVGENGEITVSSKFQANATYSPALILRNMHSKAYYEKLIANGYTKLAFNLAVEGDVTDLYVFGKLVSTFPVKDGVYSFAIDVQHIVNHYDTMKTIATSGNQVGQASSLAAKLISWKSPANDWSTARDYVFTISNAAFMATPTLEVTANDVEIAYGETTTLSAKTNWNESFVVWSTSDASIATVVDGVVTVTGENWGEVTITATIAGVSVDTIITVNAPTQLEVEFAVESKDIITVNGTTTLEATTDWNADRVVWSSSNNEVATVENGVVTGVKGGEVTITATLGELKAEKTVYVVGGLNSNQIGSRVGGYQYQDKPNYFNMAIGQSGEMIITATLSDSAAYYPMLMLRNMESKAYYQKLIDNGYAKMTFMLAVGGANAADVSDLYVFGKKLTSFPKNANGAYAVTVDVQHIVTYYDNIYGIATSTGQAGQKGSLDKMFIAWASPLTWAGSRNYVFTISNCAFRKGVLFSNNIGMRVNGWNMTTNTTYMQMDIEADGAMKITANWQAYANYGPALVLKNLESKEYYQNLKDRGYTYLTFDLKVEGEDADKLTDIHVLGTAKKVAECTQENGVYKIEIQLAHILQFYDTITTLDTSGSQAGQWASRSALFLAWRFSTNFATVPADAMRNYVFTISNSMYV